MAPNPFSGIINKQFKSLYTNAISSLLYNDALVVPCTLRYGVTKYDSCVNCSYDPIGQKSANSYLDGGPAPFPFGGICPMCNGAGKHPVESTENINLMVIWNPKEFINVGTVNVAEEMIQTLTFKNVTYKIKNAREIQVAKHVGYALNRYERASEPQPIGLGTDDFMYCFWKRVG